MIKSKKFLLSVSILMALSGSVLLGMNTNEAVYASATATTLSVEDYTKSDKLLKADGSESTRGIEDFATTVKNATGGTVIEELPEVIPREYLENKGTSTTFQYNGEEYGFYMAKEGNYFDLLLIDFEYESRNETTDIRHAIRIKPLLQESFVREYTSNGYVWKKYTATERYKYYVCDPSFYVKVANENALNLGDPGYDKLEDTGPIIVQTATNYGKVSYKTEDDLNRMLTEYYTRIILEAIAEGIQGFYDVDGYMPSVVDIAENTEDLMAIYQSGKERIEIMDTSRNLFTEMSRTAQRDDPTKSGYSRGTAFAPETEMILSADNNSFAELIVMLSDSNEATRITQVANFGIVKRKGTFASMQKVMPSDREKFLVVKQTVLFSQTHSVENGKMRFYLLENGEQKFRFTPEKSGYYTIDTHDANAFVKIGSTASGQTSVTQWFEENTDYYITVYSSQKVCGNATVDVATDTTAMELAPNESRIFKYTPQTSGIYGVAYGQATVQVYRDWFGDRQLVDSNTSGYLHTLLQAQTDYYIVGKNTTASNMTVSPNSASVSTVPEFTLAQSAVAERDNLYKTYLCFIAQTEDRYNFSMLGSGLSETTAVYMQKENGKWIDLHIAEKTGGIDVTTNGVIEAGVYYIWFQEESDQTTVTCSASACTDTYYWFVNGSVYTGEGLKRGVTYSLELRNHNNEVMNVQIEKESEAINDISLIANGSTYQLTFNLNAVLYNDLNNYSRYRLYSDTLGVEMYFPIVYDKNVEIYGIAVGEGTDDNAHAQASVYIPLQANETAKIYLACRMAATDPWMYLTAETTTGAARVSLGPCIAYGSDDFTITVHLRKIVITNTNLIMATVYNTDFIGQEDAINKVAADSIEVPIYFSGGSGGEYGEYEIANYRQFQNIKQTITSNKYCYENFALIENIVFPESIYFDPLDCTYMGTFSGNGLGIEYTNINPMDNLNRALFNRIGLGGVIQEIRLDCTYKYNNEKVSVAGIAIENRGTIESCIVQIDCTTKNTGAYLGGIAVTNRGTISNSTVYGTLRGRGVLGGIAMENYGSIEYCYIDADIYYYYKGALAYTPQVIAAHVESGEETGCGSSVQIQYEEDEDE